MIDKAGLKVVLFPRAKYTGARGLVVIKPVKKRPVISLSFVEKGLKPYKMEKAGKNIMGIGSEIKISNRIDIFWLLKRYVLKKNIGTKSTKNCKQTSKIFCTAKCSKKKKEKVTGREKANHKNR